RPEEEDDDAPAPIEGDDQAADRFDDDRRYHRQRAGEEDLGHQGPRLGMYRVLAVEEPEPEERGGQDEREYLHLIPPAQAFGPEPGSLGRVSANPTDRVLVALGSLHPGDRQEHTRCTQ